MKRRLWPQLALIAVLVAAASSVSFSPGRKASTRTEVLAGTTGSGSAQGALPQPGATLGGARTPRTGSGVVAKPGLACAAGKNGDATATGVTGSSILLGATVVESGIGASFLSGVRLGMQAVKNAVNRAGGICGRRLVLKLVDDGWDAQRGALYIQNLVEQDKVFALAVVPSSEGLDRASKSGYLRRKKIPVVGSDGMLISQYTDPYIWPVAVSTISTMHIMAKQAVDAGATRVGIVYDETYHFGIEGAYAFNAAIKRLLKKDIDGYSNPLVDPKCRESFCGITAGAASYAGAIEKFNANCTQPKSQDPEHHCDFIALLLEPSTANAWLSQGGAGPASDIRVGGPQPLFNADFATSCGATCQGMWVWTSYFPPFGQYLRKPAVADYVNDLRGISSSADYNNTFVEGGYLGMKLLVKALTDVGPNLTRENLVAVLDGMTFDGGLADPLSWSAGDHFAAARMRAFSIQYQGGFAGFKDEQTTITDPWVGMDIPK